MKHKLDTLKCREELYKRGWSFTVERGWLVPEGISVDAMQKDWIEAIEESIICPNQNEKETKNDKPNLS